MLSTCYTFSGYNAIDDNLNYLPDVRQTIYAGDFMKTILITGASSGIGRELAIQLAEEADHLILTARNADRLNELSAIIRQKCEVFVIPCDLSQDKAAEFLHQEIKKLGLNVDLLINNAGSGLTGPLLSHSIDKNHNTIALNISALTDLCSLFAKDMAERGNGRILNVASTGAFQPGSYIAVYYASKAYVYSFSLALSDELKNSGVHVSVLCPGATATEFSRRSGKADIKNSMSADEVATAAIRGLKKNKVIIIPGIGNKMAILFSKIMPDRIMALVVRKIQKKQYEDFKYSQK
jgi:short-subunit dehydrogenase